MYGFLFLFNSVLKNTIKDMSVWCNNYIDRVDKSVRVVNEELLRWHAVFYSMCQSLFYIIAFRHEDLMDSKRSMYNSKILLYPVNSYERIHFFPGFSSHGKLCVLSSYYILHVFKLHIYFRIT